jgi:hypothetical protein
MRQLKEIIFYLFIFVSIALVRYILNRKVVIKDDVVQHISKMAIKEIIIKDIFIKAENLTSQTLALNEKTIRIFCMILTHNSNLRNNQVNLF